MRPLLTAAQMREVDRRAIQRLGVPGIVLMENAGKGVAAAVERLHPRLAGADVRVVCGAGQNGGDGFVVARHLALAGAKVRILLAAPRAKIAGDAAVFAAIVDRLGTIPVVDWSGIADAAAWSRELEGAEVIVDAIFGTGLRSDVLGAPAAAIAAMNDAPAWRVAVDLPSGLDADTGAVHGLCVRAHVTATMGAAKLGLMLDSDAPVGRLEVVDLGAPVELPDGHGPHAFALHEDDVRALLPRLPASAHKGSRGHLLVVAGSSGKTGAAALVGRAALRAGAGLVTIASTRAGQAALDAKVIELMTAAYADGDDAEPASYDRVIALADRIAALAIGPGMPTGPGAGAFLRRLASELDRPMVIDADGLNLLGREAAAVLRGAPASRVLTPHPGEMARLLGTDAATVQRDRLGCARRLAADTGAVVVLKGARTIVALADGTAFVNPTATAALATAGSGDVLTGVVGALLARGIAARDAAIVAVLVHGFAGEEAATTLATTHLLAGDLPEAIGRCFTRLAR